MNESVNGLTTTLITVTGKWVLNQISFVDASLLAALKSVVTYCVIR